MSVGGYNDSGYNDKFHLLDTRIDAWRNVDIVSIYKPSSRSKASLSIHPVTNQLWLFGGQTDIGTYTDDIWIAYWDPSEAREAENFIGIPQANPTTSGPVVNVKCDTLERLAALQHEESSYDIVFNVGGGGTVAAHEALIVARCPGYRKALENQIEEGVTFKKNDLNQKVVRVSFPLCIQCLTSSLQSIRKKLCSLCSH